MSVKRKLNMRSEPFSITFVHKNTIKIQ